MCQFDSVRPIPVVDFLLMSVRLCEPRSHNVKKQEPEYLDRSSFQAVLVCVLRLLYLG